MSAEAKLISSPNDASQGDLAPSIKPDETCEALPSAETDVRTEELPTESVRLPGQPFESYSLICQPEDTDGQTHIDIEMVTPPETVGPQMHLVSPMTASSLRRDKLMSYKPATEKEIVLGYAPATAMIDIDLEAEDAMRHDHASYVTGHTMRPDDLQNYEFDILVALEGERFHKQFHNSAANDGDLLSAKKSMLVTNNKRGSDADMFGGVFANPPRYDSDDNSTDNDAGETTEEQKKKKKCWNPFRPIRNLFSNLCCFGNRAFCHINIIPLAGELTNGGCRSPLLCAIIIAVSSLWILTSGVMEADVNNDNSPTTVLVLEPFLPLLTLFMTVSGTGPVAYGLGLVGSCVSVYRANDELFLDDDEDWLKTMYTHLIFVLACAQLGLVAPIGLGMLAKHYHWCCSDLAQSVFGSTDGEDEALERFLYSRRLINWRPPLSTAHWKAKLQRETLDPGRQNRYSKTTRCLNFLLDVPIGFLKIPVKLDWSMPAQSPDADTRPATSIPVFYSIGLSIIGLLIIAVVTTLFVAFDTIRSWIHDLLKNIIINAETSHEVEQVMAKYDTYVAVTVLLFIVVIFVVLLLQAMAVMDAVHNVRKGGGNLTLDPSRKIEQLRYAGPYRVLDATSAMFFTLCIFIVVALIVIPVFDGFWFLVFLAPDTISKAVFHDLTVWLFELLLKNIVVLMFQWVFASRFLTDENNLRHPRIFAFFAPIIIVLQLSVNFIRVILSLVKTLVTIPLMFVLPMSYPNSPLHHPLMAIVFLNENANNSLKSVMSAYFLAKTQMHKIIFLGERYGVASNSFRVSIPSKPAPPYMLASVAAEGDESRSLVPKPSDRVADTFNPFGCVADGNEPFVHPIHNPIPESPKTKLIYVSLKAFGEAELYQSQRHLVRLWVLLDYFPERFPRSLTPSASLHPSLERVIFEELLEYVSWVLEPSTTSSMAVRSALDTKRGKDVDKSIRALWENSSDSSNKRTYRKEIVFEIMKAHGLVEDDKETAAAMVRPQCHLEELNWFISKSEMPGQQSPGIAPCTERVLTAAETKANLEYMAPASVFVGDESRDTVPHCDGPKPENQDVQNAQPRKEEEHLPFPGPIGDSNIRKRYRHRRAVANLYETALFEAYELLESEHVKRLHQLREEERVKKAWLIHALEHPDAVLIPIQVAVGDGPCGDYVLSGTSDREGPNSGKGKLLSASFLASISPKGPQAVARDRACWRWRLALTLMLYPALRKQRKHYLRRNSFTPVAPLRFNPTGL